MFILAILGAVQAGVTGLAIAYATVSIVGYLPIWYFLWSHYRAEWHGQSTNIDSPPSS
jgi:hypothetical protein